MASFLDEVSLSGFEFGELLSVAPGPGDLERVDRFPTRSEVEDRLVARKKAACRSKLANLHSVVGDDLDLGSIAKAIAFASLQLDRDPAPGDVVPVERDGFVEVCANQIEVAIVVEITVGGRVGDAGMIEPPLL